MATENFIETIDRVAGDLFASWNTSSTIIVGILLLYLIYPLLTWKDPETHPFLLARQAGASPIRQIGESSVYRSIEIPHGYPLRAGLAIKDPGAPGWSSGRNGDLRDIWRQAVRGPVKADGTSAGPKGKILSVVGSNATEIRLDDITRDINVIGKYLQENRAKTVAICLPNSVELLASIFAAAFYELRPVLVPYGIPQGARDDLFTQVSADVIITEAGTLDLKSTIAACSSLKHAIWVTKAGSQHMDWNVVPEGYGSNVGVTVWRELIDEKSNSTSGDVVPFEKESISKVSPLTTFWPMKDGKYEIVEYTSENLVAAVSGLNAVLARTHRLGPQDLVLSVLPLTFSYPLCVALAALFSGASLALNSVAGDKVDITMAATGVSPTVVIASSESALELHKQQAASQTGLVTGLRQRYQKRTLHSGIMPAVPPATNPALAKLRLLIVAYRAGDPSVPQVHSNVFTDLRLFLGARTTYALTAAKVAGAVAQTHVLDYRPKQGDSHFGAPLSCLEICLTGDEEKVGQEQPEGQIIVKGPAVCQGEAKLDVIGKIDDDNTLVLLQV